MYIYTYIYTYISYACEVKIRYKCEGNQMRGCRAPLGAVVKRSCLSPLGQVPRWWGHWVTIVLISNCYIGPRWWMRVFNRC